MKEQIQPVNKKTKQDDSSDKIVRSAGAVGIAIMCSRVLGLVREQIFAGMFGAGKAYDAFVVAFRIPNLLRDLLGEGALAAAFVTVFAKYDSRFGAEETWKFASTVLTFFACFLAILTIVGIYFSGSIVALLAPDFADIQGKAELTTLLTMIMFPFLIFVSLSAVVMGMLNTKGKFFVPALSSAFFNLGSIIGGVSLALIFPGYGWPAIAGMAWGTLIGGALQLLVQIPSLLKTGFVFTPSFNFSHPGLKKILLLMLPATIGLSATQINIFVNTNFASGCVEGSVSWLNYAFRMVQLPIGMFGVAISIAALPIIARYAAKKDIGGLRKTFTSSLLMVFALTIPASAALIILAEPVIRLIFERGAFTAFDTTQTAAALACYAVGLFAYSSVKVMVPIFYAMDCTRYPVIGSFIAVGANIVIITHTIDQFQHLAIALSTSFVMGLNFIFLAAVLYKKINGYSIRQIGTGLIKIGCATIIMSGGIFYLMTMLRPFLEGAVYGQLFGVMLLVVVGVSLYGVTLHLLKLPELIMITDKIKEKMSQ